MNREHEERMDELIPCYFCAGTGEVMSLRRDTFGEEYDEEKKCPKCHGSGMISQ